MKKIFQIVTLFALLGCAACSNEFDLTADWQDIPVIYAILNSASDVQYVRVEKAFIDPQKSALEIAQIPDSLYYDDAKINVFIEKVESGARFPMSRVDGNDEGFQRKGGIFATAPNWLYKTTVTLEKTKYYRVVVERMDNKPTAEATVQVPGDFLVVRPPWPTAKLYYDPASDASFEFQTDPSAARFNFSLQVTYRDQDINTGTVVKDTITWLAVTNATSLPTDPTRGTAKVPGLHFYQFLNQNIAPAAPNHVRFLEKGRIILEGGGKELNEFEALANANAGITGAETVPFYTNVQNGYGLILAKGVTKTEEYFWNPEIVQLLQDHPLTQALKFNL